MILMNRSVRVDGKVRTDTTYPAGYQDVITIPDTDEAFRLLFDVKGRFVLQKLKNPKDKTFKLCRVVKRSIGNKGIPYIVTHDGRTIRYPDPDIKVADTIKFVFEDSSIEEHYKFQQGHCAMVTGGHNIGRIGIVQKIEKHPGSYDIVHMKDVREKDFATRKSNVFIIGNEKPSITCPKTANGVGIKHTIIEERNMRNNRLKNKKR